jgi:hypothetical protein
MLPFSRLVPLIQRLFKLEHHVSRRRVLSERIDELAVGIHQIEEDATPHKLDRRAGVHSPVIHEVVVRRLCIRWCAKVNTVRLAGLLDGSIRASQPNKTRVKVCVDVRVGCILKATDP